MIKSILIMFMSPRGTTASYKQLQKLLVAAGFSLRYLKKFLVAAGFSLRFLKNRRLKPATTRSFVTGLFILTLCIGLTGCLTSKYIEQKQYLLATKTPTNKHAVKHNETPLHVNHITAETPFNQLNFLYRINKYQYLTDYYNGFLALPAQQLDVILMSYIRNSSNFTPQDIATTTSNTLKVQLSKFYADYRDNRNPKAIISMHFVLLNSSNDKVILDRIFTQKIALQTKDTEGLLSAWSIGLQNILTNATKALNRCIK